MADPTSYQDRGPARHAANTEELMEFHRWSVFLPRASSLEAERNAAYVKGRQMGNPRYFELLREGLSATLVDCSMLRAIDGAECDAPSMVEALDRVLQAQWAAQGFLFNRQFHKALELGQLCVRLVDALPGAEDPGAPGGLVFWRMLCRANLGHAYLRFRRREEAKHVLWEALELSEAGAALPAPPAHERLVAAACYGHLARLEHELGDLEEALRWTEEEIEVFERFIWEVSDTKEDREVEAIVLSTAYSVRGCHDVRQAKYDSALAWFQRAREVIKMHEDLSSDCWRITAMIQEDVDRTKVLQL